MGKIKDKRNKKGYNYVDNCFLAFLYFLFQSLFILALILFGVPFIARIVISLINFAFSF